VELNPDILIRKPNTIKGFVFGGRWEKRELTEEVNSIFMILFL